MFRPRFLFVFISILVGLSVPDSSNGQPEKLSRTGPLHSIEEYAERLAIDETTRGAIRLIVEDTRSRGQEIRASLAQARAQMRNLLTQDSPDDAAVMQQAEKIGALRVEKQKNRLRAMLQIRALLSPQQRQALTALREQERPHRRGRSHRRGRFGACRADVAELCPQAEPGQPALQCLNDNWSALSTGCQAIFKHGPHRGRPEQRD